MTTWIKALIGFVFFVIMLVVGYQQTQAPSARADSDLDYTALSRHVAVIAARPHPMGSAANHEVRDYIARYFESLGLRTEIHKTTVVYRHPFRPKSPTIIGYVENIIARLPGTGVGVGENEDLVLMAHYDSRASGPGAGDDASGTVAIMETARIMTAGPAPRHDVVFLITDGEEMGLLGAQGFFRQHPAAERVGLTLDFEARGSYGVASMFETSRGNSWLIDELIASAPDLSANSLSFEIYKRMPNDTDMSISRGEGIPGLNFAFISGLHDYHSMGDSAENLNRDTLAQQANYVLATARHFANLGTWPEPEAQLAEGDRTYFNLWNGVLVNYSQPTAVALGVIVLLLGLWLLAGSLRSGSITVTFGSLGLGVLTLFVLLAMVSNIFESVIDYLQAADAGIASLVSLGEWPFFVFMTVTLGFLLWFVGAIKRGMSKVETVLPVLVVAILSLLAGRPGFGSMGEDARAGNVSRILPGYEQEIVIRDTDMPAFEAASLEVTADRVVDGEREIGLLLSSPSNAEYINLLFSDDVSITAASVNGFDLEPPQQQQVNTSTAEKADAMKGPDKTPSKDWWRWRWYGLPASGAEIKLTIESDESFSVKIVEVNWGMPEGAPQRPANSMPKPYTFSDSRVVFQTRVID